jgi:hypothetical protein
MAVISAPASANSPHGTVSLDVENLGDRATAGTLAENTAEGLRGEKKNFVTVVDSLPTGVTPVGAYVEGASKGNVLGNSEPQIEEQLKRPLCTIAGQTVTCEYVPPVRAYEQFFVTIVVEASSGAGDGLNEVTVSGGGAPIWRSHQALALESTGYGPQSYELTGEEEGGLPSTQAGAHPFQLTSTLMLNSKTELNTETGNHQFGFLEVAPWGLTKDLRFDLPPGLLGNPTPLPKCNLGVFLTAALPEVPEGAPECPPDTVVGVADPIISNVGELRIGHAPLTLQVPLYSLEPSVGEPARFGFITSRGPVILDTSVRTGEGYGVVVTVPNILSDTPFIGSVVTFWGIPADPRHDNSRGKTCLTGTPQPFETGGPEASCSANEKPQPFLINPTSCTGPLQTSIEADSWEAIGKWSAPLRYATQTSLGEPFGMDGCNRLNFEPSITVTPDGQEASSPTGLTVGVHVPQEASLNPTGLAESSVKDTTVTLPAGVALNPSGADGLMACGLGEIGLEGPVEQSCPDAAKVGTVEIETPLLPNKLEGAVYLASQEQNPFGSLIALYIVAKDPVSGVLVKLAGEVTPCRQTGAIVAGVTCQAPGQLVSTFKNTPQLPFENLRLHFFGGARGPLATPTQCGSYTASATIAPWSGNPAGQLESPPFAITSGPKTVPYPNGSPCPGSSPPFSPELTAGSSNLQAGAFTPFTMTMSREDGQQQLDAIQLKTPPGFSGLLSGVELCPEPQASEGLCGPSSQIGETTVSVGLGGDPYTVKGGRVYVTGPYDGAPFGLSIVNPAKAGPFDLEHTKTNHPACDCLVVRARIEVDPVTAALTITSDTSGPHAIPTILEGIPLQIKHVNVSINRPGFTFNPTDCEKTAITGALRSDQGATSSLSVPFQVTNCATLAFTPKFAVSTTGKTSKANGAGLNVKLTYPNAPFGTQANIHQVKVELPVQLPSRLTTLQQACTAAQFHANPAGCPAASIVGHAKAITPLVPVPLEGPAYFVSNGGEAFPNLIVVLQGYGVTIDLVGDTFISKAGITSSTFKTVPDAPVGSFELTLPQGPYSALTANGDLCALTRTVTVKKKITVRAKNGRKRTITRKVKQTVPATLTMPTEFIAQNGAVIHQTTPVTVTGCAKTKKTTKPKKKKTKRHK